MRNPEIKLAFDTHRNKPVVSQSFEKDYKIISKWKTLPDASRNVKTHGRASRRLRVGMINTISFSQSWESCTKASLCGYFHKWLRYESLKTTEIYTHISKKELGKITNPFDEYG